MAAGAAPRTYGEGFSSGFARFQNTQEFWDVSEGCALVGSEGVATASCSQGEARSQ